MKMQVSPFLIIVSLTCLAFFPKSQAVNPPPDGGYSGGNTAEGQSALLSLSTGFYNTAVGIYSVLSLTNGSFCTGVGAGTLLANTANENTASGAGALLSNTTGTANTANGAFALWLNAEGSANTATGDRALFNSTTSSDNTATGANALSNNTASGNTAVGSGALLNNTTGGTLENIQGVDLGPNVAVGWQALENNTVASANTAVGYQALHSFTTGFPGFEQVGICTAVGFQALANATGNAISNCAFGYQALENDTEGGGNTAIGAGALGANTTGNNNIALGSGAGLSLTAGDNNIEIGNSGTVGESNTIRIGVPAFQSATFIAGISGTAVAGTAVVVDASGQLGVAPSSMRFKQEIKPMDDASQALFALEPVTFHYKKEVDSVGTAQFGLVAEDVEKVDRDLVVHDKDGRPYSVRYDQVNAMLLNEFLKEHRKVEQLKEDFQATVAQQQKHIERLTAQLQDQAAQIQKVSAQIEMSKAATNVAVSNP